MNDTTKTTDDEGLPSKEETIEALHGKYAPHLLAALVSGGDIVIIVDGPVHAVIGLSEKGSDYIEKARTENKSEVADREAVITLLKDAESKGLMIFGVNPNGMSRLVQNAAKAKAALH